MHVHLHILRARTHARTHVPRLSRRSTNSTRCSPPPPPAALRARNGTCTAYAWPMAHARQCIGSPPPPRPTVPACPTRRGPAPPPPVPTVRPMSLLCACGAPAPRDPRRRAPPARGGPCCPSSTAPPTHSPLPWLSFLLRQPRPPRAAESRAARGYQGGDGRRGTYIGIACVRARARARAHMQCPSSSRPPKAAMVESLVLSPCVSPLLRWALSSAACGTWGAAL